APHGDHPELAREPAVEWDVHQLRLHHQRRIAKQRNESERVPGRLVLCCHEDRLRRQAFQPPHLHVRAHDDLQPPEADPGVELKGRHRPIPRPEKKRAADEQEGGSVEIEDDGENYGAQHRWPSEPHERPGDCAVATAFGSSVWTSRARAKRAADGRNFTYSDARSRMSPGLVHQSPRRSGPDTTGYGISSTSGITRPNSTRLRGMC